MAWHDAVLFRFVNMSVNLPTHTHRHVHTHACARTTYVSSILRERDLCVLFSLVNITCL